LEETPTTTANGVNRPKSKSTPSLKNIFDAPAAPEPVTASEAPTKSADVTVPQLRKAWEEYAERRKGQVAEYQLMQREYQFESPLITVHLTNPVEEALLENFRRDLVQFLRDALHNNELTVKAIVKDNSGKKMIYTAKEKFDHLAEKHPYLKELKDRLGLDWEY
jgi:DNA polymerase-3 subunit gamma/tau